MKGLVLVGLCLAASAQMRDNQDKSLSCQDTDEGNRYRMCEMRETTIPATAKLEVDARPNGGVLVKGWLRSQILVRAQVQSWGDSAAESKDTLNRVQFRTDGGFVSGDGPSSSRTGDRNWSISYEIFVPQRTDLKVSSTNGGIHLADVRGVIEFTTTNGGVHLARLGGSVTGTTTNGGVHVELEGSHWDGDRLEVNTTNGGVHIEMPESYSARFEAATSNGGLHSDLSSLTVTKDHHARSIEGNIGSGGALVKVNTTNGGVHISRRS